MALGKPHDVVTVAPASINKGKEKIMLKETLGTGQPSRESYPLIFIKSIQILETAIGVLAQMGDRIEGKPFPNAHPPEKTPTVLEAPSIAEILSNYPQKLKALAEEIAKEVSRIEGFLF